MIDLNQRKKGLSKENTKIRVLLIFKMLNEGRKITTREILRTLDLQYDIQADRKTIYSDIRAIERFMPLEVIAGRYGGYKKCDILRCIKDGN